MGYNLGMTRIVGASFYFEGFYKKPTKFIVGQSTIQSIYLKEGSVSVNYESGDSQVFCNIPCLIRTEKICNRCDQRVTSTEETCRQCLIDTNGV
jgi:hypothetical protein